MSEKRKLVVITTEGLVFETEAHHWAMPSQEYASGENYRQVHVYAEAGGGDRDVYPIASFNDVHAVYFENEVTAVEPDD